MSSVSSRLGFVAPMIVVLGLSVGGCSDAPAPGSQAEAKPAFSVFAQNGDGDAATGGEVLRRVEGEGTGLPVVESLRLEPRAPESRSRMRAVAALSGRWDSVEYRWEINGARFGSTTPEVVLPDVKTGDRISVEVIPMNGVERGQSKTATASVQNQRPVLLGLGIELADERARSEFDDAEMWHAVARAEDPDGDRIEFEYRWSVNGHPADGEGEYFRVADLAKGDRLEVTVRAYDGRVWSGPARSGEVEVGNSPPEIVSTPPRVDARGQFRYDVRVEDPDGDRKFGFALRQSPRGMQIDDVNGIVRWTPDTDQAGRHSVEIVVTDEGGAEATQSFSLALVRRSDDGDSLPASPR